MKNQIRDFMVANKIIEKELGCFPHTKMVAIKKVRSKIAEFYQLIHISENGMEAQTQGKLVTQSIDQR